jgi:hypothetical protein
MVNVVAAFDGRRGDFGIAQIADQGFDIKPFDSRELAGIQKQRAYRPTVSAKSTQ